MSARSAPMERSAELREAEIELLEGSPGGLFDIAHMLFPDGGLRFSRLSKAARGYLLAEQGQIEPPLAPRNADGSCARSGSDRRAGGARHPSRVPRSDRHEFRGGPEAGRSRRAAPVADWPAPIAKRILRLRSGAAKPGNGAAQRGSPLAWPGGRAPQGSRCGGERYRAAGGRDPPGRAGSAGPCRRALAAGGGTARSPPQASRRGARAGVPDRSGAVRGDARLARSAGFRPDRAAGRAGRRVGRQGAEQALEEGRQARART